MCKGQQGTLGSPSPPNSFHPAVGVLGYLLVSQQRRLNRNWIANTSFTLLSLPFLYLRTFETLGESHHWPIRVSLPHTSLHGKREEQVGAATRAIQVKTGKQAHWIPVFGIFEVTEDNLSKEWCGNEGSSLDTWMKGFCQRTKLRS